MGYKVSIRNGYNKISDFAFQLSWGGFKLSEDGSKYTKRVLTMKDVEKVKKLCYRYRLKFAYDNDYAERDGEYRSRFFNYRKPDLFGRYFCCYCGKLLPRPKITVDHLYPVGAVSQDLKLQKKLHRMGIDNINDEANLVAACASCNSSKGKKLGHWITRGKIGRHKIVWMVRWLIRFAIIGFAAYIIYYRLRYQTLPEFLMKFFNEAIWFLQYVFQRIRNFIELR